MLVIGSLPPPFGGCSVTLQFLVEELRRRSDVELRVVDTSGIRGRGLRGGAKLLGTLARVIRLARRTDVVTLHVATPALPHWGLAVYAVARLLGRPFVLRKFADTDYRTLGWLRGAASHHVASHAGVYLVETLRHLEVSHGRGIHRAYWFPTARPIVSAARATPPSACRHFVYVGHVTRAKGLPELVAAMSQLAGDVTLDVYGPLLDDLSAEVFASRPGITYHGPLPPAEVVSTMRRYDAFVLPTRAVTEGYPGTVLEAYAAGLPVVASRIGGIPEIVDESAGALVAPGDVDALAEAMRRLCADPVYYGALRRGVEGKASQFCVRRWSERFVEHCREAVSLRVAA